VFSFTTVRLVIPEATPYTHALQVILFDTLAKICAEPVPNAKALMLPSEGNAPPLPPVPNRRVSFGFNVSWLAAGLLSGAPVEP
jgi:hypothetical protein